MSIDHRGRAWIAAAIVAGCFTGGEAFAQSGAVTVELKSGQQAGPPRITVLVTQLGSPDRLVASDSMIEASRPLRLTTLKSGRYRVEGRAVGFAPETSFVDVVDGVTAVVGLLLAKAAPVALEKVETKMPSRGRLNDFERRRSGGKGTFITEADITKRRSSRLVDILRDVRGLKINCQGGCTAQMVRSTTCEPRYFLDGFPTDASVLSTPLLDVAGVEVYRGPSEMPPEFVGGMSMCGAISVWTK